MSQLMNVTQHIAGWISTVIIIVIILIMIIIAYYVNSKYQTTMYWPLRIGIPVLDGLLMILIYIILQ